MIAATDNNRRPDWGTWLDGAEARSARASRDGTRTVNLVSRGGWWKRRAEAPAPEHPGARLIQAAAWMLFALGMGLLAVSFAAQYRYIFAERHQNVASIIEAGALDIGMIIFALLALGLARAGLPAKAERGLVVVCAAGSAVMNYAAADISSPRSVLAFCMPPLFLAVVVDRVVVTVRRHVLGMRDARSPWRVLATITLYVLRFALDPATTARGLRRCVLAAAPLPGAAAQQKRRKAIEGSAGRPGTKTARFLGQVEEQYGDFAEVPLDQVSRIAAEVAPRVRLDLGSARRELRAAVLAARPGGCVVKLVVTLLILAIAVLVVVRAAYWCWGPHKRVPRYRVRHLRLRLRLRLYPGRGHATVFELWLRWSRFAAYRRSKRARMLLNWWQRVLAGFCAWSIFIGRAHYRHGLRVPLEEHVLFVGPPRGGKTGVLASIIMQYPGPVLSSSTKADVFTLTSGLRAARGPVHMFNPQGIGGIPSTFRWNPIAGAEDPQVAIRRADAFSQAVSMGGVEDASFWTAKASDYLRAFFHAAALAGGDMRLVASWVLADNPGDAEQILAGHGAEEWAAQVAELRGAANKTIQTIKMTMSRSLAFLYDPQLAEAVLPAPGTGLDIPGFLARSGVLYMIAESRNDDASPVAALFACLANEVRFTAELMGSKMPGGRLDPPLLMALDEIVQTCPVPLPSWLSDAGGKGIQILVVTHGTGQLKSRWQDNGAQVILDTCGTQVWLPGITDTDTLDKASKLCGQAGLYEHTRPRGLFERRDRHSSDERLSRVDVMSPDMIRQLPEGRALIIRGSLAPTVARLPRAWKTRQYRRARRRGLAVAHLNPAPALDLASTGHGGQPGTEAARPHNPETAAPPPAPAPKTPQAPAARRARSHLQLLPGGADLGDDETGEIPAGHYPWSPQ